MFCVLTVKTRQQKSKKVVRVKAIITTTATAAEETRFEMGTNETKWKARNCAKKIQPNQTSRPRSTFPPGNQNPNAAKSKSAISYLKCLLFYWFIVPRHLRHQSESKVLYICCLFICFPDKPADQANANFHSSITDNCCCYCACKFNKLAKTDLIKFERYLRLKVYFIIAARHSNPEWSNGDKSME